jgi:hypothetical protein
MPGETGATIRKGTAMKSKTLITMAVASTFGWSAVAFGGNGHEVMTPYQPNEGAYVSVVQEPGFGSSTHSQSIGSTSSEAGGSVTGSTSESFGSFDQSASASEHSLSGSEDWMALGDEGIYSDFYVVGLDSGLDDSWDYYLVDLGSDQFASADEIYFLTPTYEVVLIEDMSQDIQSGLGE